MPFSAQHLKAARLHLMQSGATMKRIIQSVGPFRVRMIPPLSDPRVSEQVLDQLDQLDDREAVECLTQIGMTAAEAESFLFLSLGRLSVLPLEDTDFVAAAAQVYDLKREGRSGLQQLSVSWQPYGAVAAWYLKQHVGLQPEQRDA